MPTKEQDEWLHTLGVAKEKFLKAANDAANTVVPRPMGQDCKVIHGQVKGPDNHVLCGKHGHVVDINARMIIANNLADYAKRFPPQPKAKPGAAKPGGSAKPGAKVIDMEGEDIEVEPVTPMAIAKEPTAKEKAEAAKKAKEDAAVAKADAERLKERLHSPGEVDGIVSRLRENCDHFQLMIIGAADAFGQYADKKVEEFKQFKKAVAPLDLFGTILEFALSEISGRLGEKVGKGISEIGSKIADDIFKKVWGAGQSAMIDLAKSKLASSGDDDSVEALQQAIKDIGFIAKDGAIKISNNAFNTIDTRLTTIADRLKDSGNKLADDDATLLTDFLTGNLDEALEHFGIPSKATANAAQISAYKKMVEQFERKRIAAWNKALGDYPGHDAPTDPDDRRAKELAGKYAQQAADERQKQLDAAN